MNGAAIKCGYFDAHTLSSQDENINKGVVINEHVELDPRIGGEVIAELTSYSIALWLNYRSFYLHWSR